MSKILLIIYFFFCSLTAQSQTVNFTFQSNTGLFCSPGKIHFTQVTTGNPAGFVWDFGNGESSNIPNPEMIYENAGSFLVKLIAIYQDTTLSITRQVIINPAITTVIAYDRNYICEPGVINFSDAGNGNIASYEWDFGDGSGIDTTDMENIAHNFLAPGIYKIALKATSVSGCVDTNEAIITIKTPTISGTVVPESGCLPANTNFKVAVEIPVNSSITNYSWSFGDGSPRASTTTGTISHVYTAPGNYTPAVTITTGEGCINIYRFNNITFGSVPQDNQAYPLSVSICGSDTAFFISKATNANSYRWDFGDGRPVITADTIIGHRYGTIGIKTIIVTPAYNGCYGKTDTIQIRVVGVIAAYRYSNTCGDKKTFSLSNASRGNVSTVLWDFGDGSPTVNDLVVNHTYPSPGAFVTKLTVTDAGSGCSDIFSRVIYTGEPALVNADTAICKNASTTFSLANNYGNPAETYTWHVAGMEAVPSKDSSITIGATIFGDFNNYVVINNGASYCQDTIALTHKFFVRGPDLSFTAPTSLCLNSLYTVINTSRPLVPADSINSWHWNFGVAGKNDGTYQPQPFVYDTVGTYTIQLSAIDKNGCKDTLAKTVTVDRTPFLYVFPRIDTLCSGEAHTLIALHSDSLSWSPAAGLTCTGCDTVVASPNVTTKYHVRATGEFGCVALDSILVKVGLPFVASPLASDLYLCINDTVRLNISPQGKKIIWTPAVGLSNVSLYEPKASPVQTTTYTATLTDSLGCFTSSAGIIVHVSPLPFLSLPKKIDTLCAGKTDTLTALHSDSLYWSPSNFLNCVSCDTVVTNAASTIQYFATTINKAGCTTRDSILIKIISSSFVAIPLNSDAYICLNDTVRLSIEPEGKKIIWSPAIGLSDDNSYRPIASPAETTTYTATLTDSSGCFTSSANVIVHLKSSPKVDAGPDKFYPFNSAFSLDPFYSGNIKSYDWSPANILNCNTCAIANGIATSSNTFFIKVTSDSGCIAEDAITINVVDKVEDLFMPDAFTPNNDNLNDFFFPLARGIKIISRFSIYNRFGKLVYESKNFLPNDRAFGWNGKLNGVDQSSSVFVYYIEAIGDSGTKIQKKGSVALVR